MGKSRQNTKLKFIKEKITVDSFHKDDGDLLPSIKKAMDTLKNNQIPNGIKAKLNELILSQAVASYNTKGFYTNHKEPAKKWFHKSPAYVEKFYNALQEKPEDELLEYYYVTQVIVLTGKKRPV